MIPEISVVLPIYNEEAVILELYKRLEDVLPKGFQFYEVIFVDDGSTDNSLSIIKEICKQNLSYHYIHFSRNFGHQKALLAGIRNASGDCVVIMDSDLQDPPEFIPVLYQKLKQGYEWVYAQRTIRKGESFFKKITAKWFYRLLNFFSPIDIPLDTGDFKIMSRKFVNALKKMPEKNIFLRGQMAWLGFKHTSILYDRDPRFAGKTKYTLNKLFWFAFNGITSFSNFPLQIASFFGILFSLVAFFIMLYAFYSKYILKEAITGWTSIMVSTMFIGGVQLLCIGVIGEYLSRIANDVRNRPDYVVEESDLLDVE
jgi:dolichol-phosphate mannosyltransferase